MSFVSPAPGATETRTDQGVDWANVKRVVAVAQGKITGILNLQGFRETIIEKLSSGEDVYYGEESGGGSPVVHVGQQVNQGQTLAPGTGGVIEAGFWDPRTGRSQGAPGYREGMATQAGARFRNMIGKSPSLHVPNYVPAQYVPWVRRAAQGTGLPASVVAAQIDDESSFDPNSTSPTGAQGIAQFEPGTWKSWGHGSAYDPSAALPAYTAYMGSLLRQYNGNIRNALAAYNAGPANLSAGYGYADNILSKAGVQRTASAGGGTTTSTPISRPGGDPVGQDGSGVDSLLSDYENELKLPRTAPQGFVSLSQAGWKAPFQWWWQSFASQYHG